MSNKKTPTTPIKSLLNADTTKRRFNELLGRRASGFVTSVIQLVNDSKLLQQADPATILNAAATAAALNLPLNKSLGRAYVVPYNTRDGVVAQFQIGYKGLVDLGQRTRQYTRMNALAVYENQFQGFDRLSEELRGDFSQKGIGDPVGYAAYFELTSGFRKTVFWETADVLEHAQKYSKSFNKKSSAWQTDFDPMAKKTLLRHALNNWGPLSVELETALVADQSVQRVEGQYEYDDRVLGQIESAEQQKQAAERDRLLGAIEKAGTIKDLEVLEPYARQYDLITEYDNRFLTLQNNAANE